MRVRLLVLALLLAAAGASAAQAIVQSSTGVLLSDLGGPVPADWTTNMTVTITYRHGVGAVALEPVRVTVQAVEVPPWANFTLERSEVTFEPGLGEAAPEQRVVIPAALTLAPRAPAFERGNLTIVAEASSSGNIAASRGQSQIFVVPAFDGSLRLSAPQELRLRGGVPHVMYYTVENLGNAEALVEITLPLVPERAVVSAPEPVTLRPGESATRDLLLRASWVEPGRGPLTISALATVPGRVTEAEPVTHDVLVVSAAAVPGPGLLAAFAAAAVALLRRRA